jgi:hypothetical protein
MIFFDSVISHVEQPNQSALLMIHSFKHRPELKRYQKPDYKQVDEYNRQTPHTHIVIQLGRQTLPTGHEYWKGTEVILQKR